MGLEIAILSESMSDRAGEVSYNIPYMWNLKRKENKWTYLQNRLTNLENNVMAAGVGDGGKDGGKRQGVWDGHVHTAIFKTDKQQGPTV